MGNPKERNRPVHSTTVRTYAELREDFEAFDRGRYNFMIVLGSQGLGKSEMAKQTISGDPLLIDTKVSAFQLYCELYENADETVVIDDVPDLHKNVDIVALLKSLTDTRPVKTVSWHTAAVGQRRGDPPHSFETRSRLVLIANEWSTLSESVKALESRGVTFVFEPSPWEVHREIAAGGWFNDPEVYDALYRCLHFVKSPSFRLYIQASVQRQAQRPWKRRLLEWIIDDAKLRRVAEIMIDPAYHSETERAEAFARLHRTSTRTYWRLKKEFKWYGSESEPGEEPDHLGLRALDGTTGCPVSA